MRLKLIYGTIQMENILCIKVARLLIGVYFMLTQPASYIQYGVVLFYQILQEHRVYRILSTPTILIGQQVKFTMQEGIRGL